MKPASSSSTSLTKLNMKEYFIHKIFGSTPNTSPNANAPRSIFTRQQHTYARASDLDDDPHEWEFYPEYHPQEPLPEGIVMDSPVYGAPTFHSPTPPSPPHRMQRSISLDTEKSGYWDISKVQESLKRRLSWIRSTVSKMDVAGPSEEHIVQPFTIECLNTPENMREAAAASNDSFLESIKEEIEFLDLPDDARVTFCDAPCSVFEFEAMETLDELVVRVSEGFAAHDQRPAQTKLLGFCTKSLTYLKYRGSPCAEVFALSSNDISMWRRLGHFDWSDDAKDEDCCHKEHACCNRFSNESTASEESDDNQPNEEAASSHQVPVVRGNLLALVGVMNSVLCKGDASFTLSDIDHLCKDVTYPDADSDVAEDDGWC
ncbi:hypothetical protein DYB26_009393 [Aphanomyces astaci]|uniref:Uncharacterized protein n=2 Tax=Aphanomyces astaci TaxID=112090 RepID=A0A397DPQ8_APHAT|nr:hypothetical protein DYB36_013334 [Aphanomyces astaci]RHY66195.1 hypothetical protein DYB38_008364 [Aphanomyces astaci]RHZ38718.1 hypothetical protein DYB26_009393 [Aphanomyces astaci]